MYPVGTIIEAMIPPSDKWVRCVGQVELQSAYPQLFAMMDNPHCTKYWRWVRKNFINASLNLFSKACWGGGTLVVVGADAAFVSSDLINWTRNTIVAGQTWTAVAWNGSVFCAINQGANNYVGTSPNGITWTTRVGYNANNRYDICWTGQYFLACGYDATIWGSTDGISWVLRSTLTAGYAQACVYNSDICSDGNGKVIVANDYAMFYSSDHGATWTIVPGYPTYGGIYGLSYENSKWFACCEYRSIGFSDDGWNWTFREYPLHDQDMINPPDMHGWYDGSFYLVRYLNDRYWILTDSYRYYWTQDWKTLTLVPCVDEYNGWSEDIVWDSARGKLVMITDDLENFTYELDDLYNTATHFQFPIFPGSKAQGEHGKNFYIKVRS
jgi:hypothetical protein